VRLKPNEIDSQRMVIRVEHGKEGCIPTPAAPL
jgi:hypothetical protein